MGLYVQSNTPYLAMRVKRMTAFHGTVTEFHPSSEDWILYDERLDYYFAANNVSTDKKKCSILLNACGIPMLKLMKRLIDLQN